MRRYSYCRQRIGWLRWLLGWPMCDCPQGECDPMGMDPRDRRPLIKRKDFFEAMNKHNEESIARRAHHD
jgi:hypothetical protein